MAGRRVDFLGVPRRRAVPPAVVRRAEMRSTLEHPARNFHARRRIDTRIGIGIAGIARNAARLGGRFRVAHGPVIRGPLPHIADHVVEAVAVRRVKSDRRCSRETIVHRILDRKTSLPSIGHVISARRKLAAPGKFSPIEAAAGRQLPLGLGREVLAGPFGIGLCVAVSDMDDRMIQNRSDAALAPERVPPVGTQREYPPLRYIRSLQRSLRGCEDERTGP